MEGPDVNVLIVDGVKRGQNAREIHEYLLEQWPDICPSYSTVARKVMLKKRGENIFKRQGISGQKKIVRTQHYHDLVQNVIIIDPRLSVRCIAEFLHISSTSVFNILTKDLNMRKLCCRWVPHALTKAQMDARVAWCERMIDGIRESNGSVLDRIVTLDETYVYYYEPLLKKDSREWTAKNQTPPTKVVAPRSTKKVGITVMFDKSGWYDVLTLPKNSTWNSTYVVNKTLPSLLKSFRIRRPRSGFSRMMLHWDNAPCHSSEKTSEFIVSKSIEETCHPAYSPDLAPCDFYIFPKLKQYLRGKRFQSDEELLDAIHIFFKKLKKSDYEYVFNEWQRRMVKCIDCRGIYFEKV